ncbi:Cof-type HAD-IIB family hydrolase [Bacteroides sp.]|uniref:Cof-type HAD-IIB family hydrolase n=1 Tax=Bacteroides sp. TaxID=29523 RepID=UPI001B611055|nr:Cof-type HAD-IIB family hydrolase [Bacteroides sp.]MBP6064427.1 Cof-type HAD-IIB family hydrolase [Bacteroides sp.]MBP6067236.1 Cof-type HAD-IIB family hydrolase [Bacteroides sp.]MBP6936227.1 Cof-type HAD-IIB family hydrolase [Bacteroides sp.]MBP8621186.1 Cof-type HAD-IIB family hydrolase [Bacteroides sp.]MBP9506509.1 Cof-type HAD-IIB family hydrolase [Bacteroides sp.]
MKYKLLVLDVDGTLLNTEQKISARTHAAILKVQQMGVRVVLASGRPTYGLMPLVKALELGNYGGYILSYNGGQIINAQNGELLFERRINPEMVPYIEKQARKNGFDLFTYHEERIITTSLDNEHILREAEINNMQLVKEEEFSIAIDFAPCKCMLVSDDEEALVNLEDKWRKRLNGALDVFRSESYFLEVVPPSINKANTLGALLEILEIKSGEVIAIGDGVCDVSMLQLAGLGIAMGNAPHSVKVCADMVTESNDEDGVALAIEKSVLADIHPEDVPLDLLNEQARHALMGNLGIQYTYTSEDRIEATMPVDERTRQPFGILHGGATLALAETVAGLGSMILCQPDEFVVGMQVSGNHISSAHEGDTVRAVATIVHKGRSSHVWNVDVFTSTAKLVSSIRVVNSILKRR